MSKPDDDDSVASSNADAALIPTGVLPRYLATLFEILYEQDGLAVLGRGLGALPLLAALVRFYADPTVDGHAALAQEDVAAATSTVHLTTRPSTFRPPLVLVLGLRDSERAALVSLLESWNTPPAWLPHMITNEQGQSKDRVPIYQNGGVCVITPRILIVDLLSNVVDANAIDGVLLFHAEHVTDTSTEAFIVRILAHRHRHCFFKAMSEAPEALMSGFAQVDKVMKHLHVRKLYLWPRFHDDVRQELETAPPQVTELHVQLSQLQTSMQEALAAAVQACIRELKKSTQLLDWTDENMTVENCVTQAFDVTIRSQLQHDWHRIGPRTKQLVQDLRTLRTLFGSLLTYDCVTFYKLLQSLKTMSAASRHASLWLLTPAADVLFRAAKQRVYQIVPLPNATPDGPQAEIKAKLEENSKWKLLRNVLEEIKQEHDAPDARNSNKDTDGPTTVLIMVKDVKQLETLRSYLVDGTSRTLLIRWLRYLEQANDRHRSSLAGGAAKLSEESRLLLEEESRVRRVLFGDKKASTKHNGKRALNAVPAHIRKRRRVAVEKGRGELTNGAVDDLERQAVLDDAVEDLEHHLARKMDEENEMDEYGAMFRVTYPSDLHIVLQAYANVEGDQHLLMLQDYQPRYIVLYDSDVAFIRATEVYASLTRQPLAVATDDPPTVRVFLLMTVASAEEKAFASNLEREQNAFERLIQHKRVMPPPALHDTMSSQEIQAAGNAVAGTYAHGTLPLAADTRRGRGKYDASKERRDVVVDVREFRSALPSILHQGGMRLAPVTLTVGDFVLSSAHCVERKSISDLFGSFASGRLYTQAEAMCKHYACPCLLIEFDPSKSFSLQNATELGMEIRNDSTCSKMSLLVMSFPQLRILWSKGPHETLKLFQALKAKHDEPDVERAMEVGRSESAEALLQPDKPDGANDDDDEYIEVNEAARDMLLRMPGVTVAAARRIMEKVESLAELSELSRDELRQIAGPSVGQKLFTFFRQKM